MLNKIQVGTKLTAGFVIVAAVSIVVGAIGLRSAREIEGVASELYDVSIQRIIATKNIAIHLRSLGNDYRGVALAATGAAKETSAANYDRTSKELADAINTLKELPSTNEERELFRKLEGDIDHFNKNARQFIDGAKKIHLEITPSLLDAMNNTSASGISVLDNVARLVELSERSAANNNKNAEEKYHNTRGTLVILIIIGVLFGIGLGVFLSKSFTDPLHAAAKMMDEMSRGHFDMRLNMKRGDEIGVMAKEMDDFAGDLHKVVLILQQVADGDLSPNVKTIDDKDELHPAIQQLIESLRGLIIEDGGRVLHAAAEKNLTLRLKREYHGEFARLKDDINKVVQSLDDAMHQVAESAIQVSAASDEISKDSQHLAECSSDQASTLEEISSSLEQTSSMTKQSADNSNQAKILVDQVTQDLEEADDAMKRMATAIKEIKHSSDNTAKIIKTIDEIAFQTNLLALNAAVEAARAGEAGKGFAVVAEEVRNLAMRSAEAAKNTATLIEESVKNSESGVKITEEVAKALNLSIDHAGKVGGLIAEIAAACSEQATGIEHVNNGVAHMSQVIQQIAADSEETASAAEMLNSQTSELENMVGKFEMTGGQHKDPHRHHPQLQKHTAALPDKRAKKPKALPAPSPKAVKAEQIIPLDDNELSEF
ncbi:MAG: methyl-accepting chemotaxis protein [Chitinispirillales bacterium]|nr:methyl-accepting chemotaxis protein [Chitinispirillales bacterium]